MLIKMIDNEAKKLGIEMIGYTGPLAFYSLEETLRERIKKNESPEFEEKDIMLRIDPKKTMDNCKSIIVVGLSYYKKVTNKSNAKIKGSLSRSSWGIDYHRVLKDHMESLTRELKKSIDFEFMIFTDTGPLVDREVAHRAGLGYYGKNCSLINPKFGSYFFIGYILTNLDLNINESPLESECGDCDLCLRACPTNALIGAGKLKANKCISYLTQTKNPINEELTKKMGIKIYGCDTCQVVCPKNIGIKESSHDEFIPYKTGGFIDIEELLKMSKKDFNNKYRDMAGSWRGKSVLIRNALISLNNIGIDDYYDLVKTIDNKEVELLKPYTKIWLDNYMKRQNLRG